MKLRFKVTEYISKYMIIEDEWKTIEVKKAYSVETWDDLQTLLMNLIDFSDDPLKFEVRKEIAEAEEEADG